MVRLLNENISIICFNIPGYIGYIGILDDVEYRIK